MITAHFVDSDWCLNKRIISFSAIEDHRGKSIGKKIVACLIRGMMMHLCWQDNICMCIDVHTF